MLVTHMHPDHVGNAQWLIERYSAQGAPARLWMSQSDYQGADWPCNRPPALAVSALPLISRRMG